MLKKIFLLFCIFSCFMAFANDNIPRLKNQNYEEIYETLEEADFSYLFGIDPNQADDYTKYMHSPYPLFRTGVSLIFKSITIPPGYYLLTPREKNGKTYILFKENGKIKYTIPTYEVDIVPEMFYEDKFPRIKPTWYQNVSKKTMSFIGTKWGKKNQRTPIPNAYIDFSDAGYYWNMILYYGNKKYSVLFKKDE